MSESFSSTRPRNIPRKQGRHHKQKKRTVHSSALAAAALTHTHPVSLSLYLSSHISQGRGDEMSDATRRDPRHCRAAADLRSADDALLLFLMLRRQLRLPRELSNLLAGYGSKRYRIPVSHLQFLDDEVRRDMTRECRDIVLRESISDVRGGIALVSAIALERVGEACLSIDPMFYLFCLCISRRALVREAHFDVAWALAYAFDTTPRAPYPIPRRALRTRYHS
jgi:hypothetical protein